MSHALSPVRGWKIHPQQTNQQCIKHTRPYLNLSAFCHQKKLAKLTTRQQLLFLEVFEQQNDNKHHHHGTIVLLWSHYFQQCPAKGNILVGKHAGIQPGANKSAFAMLTAYISFSSLKSQTEPPLGVILPNGIPQRPHDGMAGAREE